MNYRQMLDKFEALEDVLWELSERVAKLEKQHVQDKQDTGFKQLMEQGS